MTSYSKADSYFDLLHNVLGDDAGSTTFLSPTLSKMLLLHTSAPYSDNTGHLVSMFGINELNYTIEKYNDSVDLDTQSFLLELVRPWLDRRELL